MADRIAVFSPRAFEQGLPAYAVQLTNGLVTTATFVGQLEDYLWPDKVVLGPVVEVTLLDEPRPFTNFGI